jgi:hypothetical protein
MDDLARAFFGDNPRLRLVAVGASGNDRALDLAPFGVRATFLPAERHGALVARYREENARAFPAELALPGWVLADLYLLPGAIGMLLGEDDAIAAAYVAAPSVEPGAFVGVSLLSTLPGVGAGAWVKALTLRMLRARRLRGVVQWSSGSLRAHTRMGPLRIVSAVPGSHELGGGSFVYETDLSDEGAWAAAMQRRLSIAPTAHVAATDGQALAALVARAEAGERILVVPPGLDDQGRVALAR